jgi:hypothetical protein
MNSTTSDARQSRYPPPRDQSSASGQANNQSSLWLKLPGQSSPRPLQLNVLRFVHLQGQPRLRIHHYLAQPRLGVFPGLALFEDWTNSMSSEDRRDDGNEFHLRHLLSRACSGPSGPRKELTVWHSDENALRHGVLRQPASRMKRE